MKIKRTELAGEIPVFQHDKGHHHAQGGFNLSLTGLTAGAKVQAGSVLGFDEATRVATLIKSATVVEAANSSATAYKVAKGHGFIVGDFIGNGGNSKDITAIDTSNADYDVITPSATLGAAAEGANLFQAKAASASAAAPIVTPKGLLYKSVIVPADDYVFVDVVLRGTVYARRIPGVADVIKAELPNIIFSQSF